jgi:hypothetical protein
MSTEAFADDRRPLVWSVREEGIDLLKLFDVSDEKSFNRQAFTSEQNDR